MDKLKRGLRSKKIPCRVSNSCRHKQAACFKSLEKDIGGPRLDAALNYFVENIDDPDLPVISGAKEFCNGCFNWIDKMARNAGELPEEDRNNLEEKWEETLPDGTKLRHTRIKR